MQDGQKNTSIRAPLKFTDIVPELEVNVKLRTNFFFQYPS